ncbi:MAG: twin-arginine translocase subunit TatC, partial [Verrucomicrobiota bacterium]
MSEEPELLPVEADPPDEGGGPVKTFLEHLEDLRWTLVKSVVAVVVAILACLSGANWIIKVLTWPLEKAEGLKTEPEARLVVTLGTNVFSRMTVSEAARHGFPLASTNEDTFLRLAPLQVGTNWILGLAPDTNPPPASAYRNPVTLSILGPAKAFAVLMEVAVYGGFVLATPFILFFLGQFILPALHIHEKRLLFKVAGAGTGLFMLGVAFCYFLILVICLSTTQTFTRWLGFSADLWSADEYISFVCWFMLGMGVAFQLPLVLLTLVKIGILDAAKLSKFRSYWVVAGLLIAAFITPDGNPLNMLLL